MKKTAILLLLFLGLASCKEESGTKVLYLAHGLPQTHPVHKGILEFQKALEKKSNGTLKVKIFDRESRL